MTVVLCKHGRIRGYDCPVCLSDAAQTEVDALKNHAQSYACIGNGLYVRTAPAKRRRR